jgi:CRP-like cAMP-binding protein
MEITYIHHVDLHFLFSAGAFHICKVTTGGIFGDNTFILNQPHSMRAVALIRSYVFVLNRDRFHEMEKNHPKLLFIMQQVLLKSLAMSGEMTVQQLYPAPWKAI